MSLTADTLRGFAIGVMLCALAFVVAQCGNVAESQDRELMVARAVAGEAGLDASPDEASAIVHVLTRRGVRYSAAIRTCRQAWVCDLRADGSEPDGWPSQLVWERWAPKWRRLLRFTGAVMAGDVAPRCRADHFGAPHGRDLARATRAGWTRADCGVTRNIFWTVRPPRSAVADGVDRLVRHAVASRDRRHQLARCDGLSNRGHLRPRELGARRGVGLASAALRPHVGEVVGVRSEKQMRRVHTRAVVAPVADVDVGGDWAVVQLPRHAVRARLPTRAVPHRTTPEGAIAVAGERSLPQPTAGHRLSDPLCVEPTPRRSIRHGDLLSRLPTSPAVAAARGHLNCRRFARARQVYS